MVRFKEAFAADRDLTSTVELKRTGVLSLERERMVLLVLMGLLGSVAKRRAALGLMASIVLSPPSSLSLISMAAYFLSTFCLSALSAAISFSI